MYRSHIPAQATTDAFREVFGDPISSYSREAAHFDGVLIDVSIVAREIGFGKFPVSMTAEVFDDCVRWDAADSKRQTFQNFEERLLDVLLACRHAARRGGSRIMFDLRRIPRDGKSVKERIVRLKAVIGPGDRGEPVITIMLPDQD